MYGYIRKPSIISVFGREKNKNMQENIPVFSLFYPWKSCIGLPSYRGFESLSLRQYKRPPMGDLFVLTGQRIRTRSQCDPAGGAQGSE